MRKLLNLTFVLILTVVNNLFAQNLILNNYTGQSEISANGSITLTDGFHVQSGQSVCIFINNVPSQLLSSIPSGNQNYVISTTYRKPYTSSPSNPTTDDVIQEIRYYDGLGRSLQDVTTKGSPSFKDIVQPIEYDNFGREAKKYLPYTIDGNPGSFRPTSTASQATFYNAPPNGVKGSAEPYSFNVFEASPLNRILEQGAPGAFWQPLNSNISGSGHTVKTEYTSNDIAFSDIANTRRVALYGVSIATDGTPTLVLQGAYANNQLYVTISKDENWKSTDGRAGTKEEYTDKEGRTVLKRSFNKKRDGSLEMMSTYFVFDDFGDLTYVLPPGREGEFDSDASTVPNISQLNNFCYQYRFDGRRRMVEKRVPGKDVEYLVYNKLDQVVLTQDAVQREKSLKEWTFTKYDAFGRVVMTGRYTTASNSRATVQAEVDAHLTLWEVPHASNATRYANTSFPSGNGAEVYSYTYYDNYDLPTDCPSAWRTLGSSHSNMTKGLQTASKIKVMGTDTYLWTVNYYDNEAQVIQANSQHNHGGADVITNSYNFSGQLTSTVRTHNKATNTTTVKERYDYDHQGRLLNTYHQINTQPEVLLSSNVYNELGAVMNKKLHSEDSGNNFLQKLHYEYNIRGWLSSINKSALNTSENDLFGLELKYTNEDRLLQIHPGQYNGNISEVIWNTARANKSRGYAFNYDEQKRLIDADYRAYNGNWTSDTENGRFSEGGLVYDKMGNILQLKRNGINSASTFGIMDDLDYTYSGNKLLVVNEKSTGNRTYGFNEPNPAGSTEYTYDINGNLKGDLNKGITAVNYNYLNIPEQVTIGGNTLNYRYTVQGIKIQKTAGSDVTHYINGIQYSGDQINFIQTSEGRILRSPSNGQYSYEYHLKDHQGNVRVGFDKDPSTGKARIIQEDSYYPFGLMFNSYMSGTQNKYTFQGQEIQDEYGLNWSQFKWRMHDPAIGRFISIDPLATDYTHNSPYAFSENRVVNGVELEGLEYMTYGYNAQGARANIQATAQRSSGTETEKKQNAAMMIDILPGIGDAKGFVEAFTGKDLVSGEKLGWASRAAGLFLLSELRTVDKAADAFGDAAKITSNIAENAKQGKEFEGVVTENLKQTTHTDIAEQVTIKPEGGGGNVRVDNISRKDGKIKLTDAKSSATAQHTKNQKAGYPLIEQKGGKVVGNKGKDAGYPNGTVIPPTKVDIIRPNDIKK